MSTAATDGLLARTLREEAGPLVARLSRRCGDFDLAEEAVQSAVVEALTGWRRDGPPDNPAAWLQVAAQRNALDAVRESGLKADDLGGIQGMLVMSLLCAAGGFAWSFVRGQWGLKGPATAALGYCCATRALTAAWRRR